MASKSEECKRVCPKENQSGAQRWKLFTTAKQQQDQEGTMNPRLKDLPFEKEIEQNPPRRTKLVRRAPKHL